MLDGVALSFIEEIYVNGRKVSKVPSPGISNQVNESLIY